MPSVAALSAMLGNVNRRRKHLGPKLASFKVGTAAGTKIADFRGLHYQETVTAVTPNTTLAIGSGGLQLNVGATPATAGDINAVLTTSNGRTLNMVVNVYP